MRVMGHTFNPVGVCVSALGCQSGVERAPRSTAPNNSFMLSKQQSKSQVQHSGTDDLNSL